VPLDAGSQFEGATGPAVEMLLTQDLVRQDYLNIEPSALAERIKKLVESGELLISSKSDPRCGQPVRYRDIAILLRQLTDIQRYEDALARTGVPYFVVGGGRGYYARQEIRDLVNILTVLDTPFDDIALLAALRSPMVGADLDTIYHIVQHSRGRHQTNDDVNQAPARKTQLPLYVALQQLLDMHTLPEEEHAKLRLFVEALDPLRAQQDRMPVGHLLERLFTQTLYDVRLLIRQNGKRRLANVRKLAQMAHAEPAISVREFIQRLRDLERLSDREGDAPTEEEAADVVRIHTMHGAKGLEFPVVILADLCRSLEHVERGLFVCDPRTLALGTRICGAPDAVYLAIDHARQRRDKEEAERLLYVAMTRARERLVLCGNLGRNRGRNWGDLLFPALGVIETPPHPVTQPLIGGLQATVAPLTHYVHTSIVGERDSMADSPDPEAGDYADRLVEALLTGTPLESVTR
jgi:ATP-dependent helicase/nuclease subunit A